MQARPCLPVAPVMRRVLDMRAVTRMSDIWYGSPSELVVELLVILDNYIKIEMGDLRLWTSSIYTCAGHFILRWNKAEAMTKR